MSETMEHPIVEYNEIKAQMEEVRNYADFIPNASTDEGYAKSKRVSLDIGKLKTALENKRKEKKSFYLEGGKLVDSKAKVIAEQLEEMQSPHMSAYKELDNIRKQREIERKEGLTSRIANMRDLASLLSDSSSEEIQAAMEQMSNEECGDFYEFTADALKARNAARSDLAALYTKTVKQEKEADELAELRKLKAIRDQKDHDERIAKEASAEAEAKAQAATKQLQESEQRRIDQAQQAEQREAQAAEQAKAYAIESEQRAKAQAEAAAQAERNNIEQARLKLENEAKARKADSNHRSAVNNEILTAILTTGITEDQAKAIICLAVKGHAGNMRVTY